VAVVLFGAAAGILLFAFEGHDVVSLVQCLLWFLSVVTIFAALAMVTSRRPVYAAIWFALTLLGVGGLMFLAGAQFLGVATVAVYAGAIVVTFLFVLMLAQPSGDAFYDRMSWSVFRRWLASLAGMAMASLLAWTARMVVTASEPSAGPANASAGLGQAEHVAALGGQLFSKYLVEIQVAGVLLLVALVGAIAMAAQRVAKHDIAARLDEALRVAKGRGGTYRG
jgi:NADH-quinone oxidoreductase subunit J